MSAMKNFNQMVREGCRYAEDFVALGVSANLASEMEAYLDGLHEDERREREILRAEYMGEGDR